MQADSYFILGIVNRALLYHKFRFIKSPMLNSLINNPNFNGLKMSVSGILKIGLYYQRMFGQLF